MLTARLTGNEMNLMVLATPILFCSISDVQTFACLKENEIDEKAVWCMIILRDVSGPNARRNEQGLSCWDVIGCNGFAS